MVNKVKSEYATELAKRVAKADAHCQEMCLKYWQTAYDMGRGSSFPGFDCWETETKNSHGQTTWEYEYPMPYSGLRYESLFLRVLRWVRPQLLIPNLEVRFAGDLIDRDYIEGLLVSLEELGATTPGKILIAHDIAGVLVAGPNATIKSLSEVEYGPKASAHIESGELIKNRISIVRRWLKRKKRESTPNASPLIEQPSTPIPKHIFSSSFTREQCTNVLVAALIIHDEEAGHGQRNPKRPAEFYGSIQALVNNRKIIGEVKHLAQLLAGIYKVQLNPKTDFKESIRGESNKSLRRGRIETEKALTKAGLLDRKTAYYLVKEDEIMR